MVTPGPCGGGGGELLMPSPLYIHIQHGCYARGAATLLRLSWGRGVQPLEPLGREPSQCAPPPGAGLLPPRSARSPAGESPAPSRKRMMKKRPGRPVPLADCVAFCRRSIAGLGCARRPWRWSAKSGVGEAVLSLWCVTSSSFTVSLSFSCHPWYPLILLRREFLDNGFRSGVWRSLVSFLGYVTS